MTTARKFAYALILTVAFFGFLEAGLRLVDFSGRVDDTRFILNPEWDYPEYFLKDRELFWRFRPDQVITSNFFVTGEYHINNHGLRGPDFTPQKAPGTYRIICLGNSCTFGWRVREQEVYPRQTQAILEQRLPQESWEVINAGVTGYTSLQGLRFLRREVLRWQPDLLIINYCWNDHWAAAQDIADKDQRLPSQWILDLQNTFNCTYTYRWLKYLVFSLKKPPAADFSRDNPVYRVSAEDFRENLRRMITLATERKIPVLLLTAPIAERADPRFSGVRLYHDKYNGVIRSFSDTAGVFVLDAAAEFSRYTDLFDHPERDLKHYNANGHSIIARMIAEYISRLRNRNY